MSPRVLFIPLLSIALILIFFGAAFGAEAGMTPYAAVESGALDGDRDEGLAIFKGIPYAAPPAGDLRWRAPKPPLAWSRTRQAKEFGPACPQEPSKRLALWDMSEDCLTLNIWSPATRQDARMPVMVWLHGGSFEVGSARLPIYDGGNLARKGVVVVTLNYRLGFFGFFGHPLLTEEAKADNAPTANFGLLDQIAALQWVQRNIQAFGGDPGNVTLFGESAGGISTLALMTASPARGLFHKAIIQSGGGRWSAPSLTSPAGKCPSAYEIGRRAAEAFGLSGDDALRGLRNQSWQAVRNSLAARRGLERHCPFLDGWLLTEQMATAFERGAQMRIPVIVGANSYEGVILRSLFRVNVRDMLDAMGPHLGALSALYPAQFLMTPGTLADHIWGDAAFVEPARMIARSMSKTGEPVYHYGFDFQPPILRLLGGTPHGLDVLYTFGNIQRIFPLLAHLMHPVNFEVSGAMTAYWTNFAKSADPNGRGAPLAWPRFKEGGEETLVFGNRGLSVERDYLKQRLDLFNGVLW